ncbi:MAG: hypothetical protein PHQ27_01530 [Victivallales bacterium]|nr:hypothetical protein [Victivallales bacterium]
MTPPVKIETLLQLLDDPNQQAASLIMAELLECEAELPPYLAALQEADDPLLRRRVHQLETIMNLRRRRREFAEKLRRNRLGLLDGLIEIHLQWYDNDAAESIRADWEKLLREAEKTPPESLEKLAYFMRKAGFSSPQPNDLQADYYCLGVVLDDHTGADVLLCAMCRILAQHWGCELQIIQVMENFALIDKDMRVLTPKDGWRVHPPIRSGGYNIWDRTKVLKFAMSMLFLCAVSTDSFRYVNTIGGVLEKIYGLEGGDFLPFPYSRSFGKK